MVVDGWARSGAMDLTGWPDGPPLHPGRDVTGRLDQLTHDIRAAGGPAVDWGRMLTARAGLTGAGGATRKGRISVNGTCRLIPATGGWVALSMSREVDWETVPALIGRPGGWEAVEEAVAGSSAESFVAWARELGLAAAVVAERQAAWPRPAAVLSQPAAVSSQPAAGSSLPAAPSSLPAAPSSARRRPPWRAERRWPRRAQPGRLEGALVVDLSALWAGPLAAHLLASCGARVIKVESRTRPDTARLQPGFYDQLHAPDQEVVVLDFADGADLRQLRRLLARADVVIEASRPRALEQLGCGPCDVAPERAGRVWLSITGHGRAAPYREWVAFGDDAAASGGLVAWDPAGSPVFCADAMADPVTGLFGALAVLRSVRDGGGVLLDLPMAECAAALAAALTVLAAAPPAPLAAAPPAALAAAPPAALAAAPTASGAGRRPRPEP